MCGGENHCQPLLLPPVPQLDSVPQDRELFTCLVCLELIYKPIVIPCGHVFCFWCLRRSMNVKRQSQCPTCRRPYIHFPRICEMLHFFLMSARPDEYKRRALDIHEMEQMEKVFSPRLLQESPISFKTPLEPDDLSKASPGLLNSLQNLYAWSLLEANMTNDQTHSDRSEVGNVVHLQERSTAEDAYNSLRIISPEDFRCVACHKFLYRPVVRNCGEVFCESCLKTSSFVCPSCESCDPIAPIHVCLELHQYLEAAFTTSYLERRKEIEQKAEEEVTDSNTSCDVADEITEVDETDYWFVHIGTGCDGCGMFPIVGHRYHCKDCSEQIGFDLCGRCYRSGADRLCGRFNQQHTSAHCMEEMFSERRWANAPPLIFNVQNGRISHRRLQQVLDDFDDYIDSLV